LRRSMYEVLLTKKAEKEINKLARVDSSKLIAKLLNLVYPFPSNFDIDKIWELIIFTDLGWVE